MKKVLSEACERNREPIFRILQETVNNCQAIFEVGSGTGQHAAYMAPKLPHLVWQTSDLPEKHEGIQSWVEGVDNILPPVVFDLAKPQKIHNPVDCIYTANTLHIVAPSLVENFFQVLPAMLKDQGRCVIYGPFNYNGQFTSQSNADFHQWLQSRDPRSGIRDFEWIETLATTHHLALMDDHGMPANNRMLVFQKL